jgi:hypothetical protein
MTGFAHPLHVIMNIKAKLVRGRVEVLHVAQRGAKVAIVKMRYPLPP